MSSQTSLVAAKVRLQEWALQIRACQDRPAGMKVQEWCDQQGISKHCYYYRLNKVREAMLDTFEPENPVFVELHQTSPSTVSTDNKSDFTEAAATVPYGSVKLYISNKASAQFLRQLMEALQSC